MLCIPTYADNDILQKTKKNKMEAENLEAVLEQFEVEHLLEKVTGEFNF